MVRTTDSNDTPASNDAPDTALRFGHWFGVEAQFWLNLQTQFDLAVAEESIGAELKHLPTAAVPA